MTTDTETRQINVTTDSEDARAAITPILASLPVSYRSVTDAGSQLLVTMGSRGWPARAAAALDDGCRAMLILNPADADPDDVERLADKAEADGRGILLSETFAGNPIIPTLLASHVDTLMKFSAVFLNTLAAAGTPADLILTQLRVLRALGLTDVTIETSSAQPHSVIWAGHVGGRPATGGTGLYGIASTTAVPQARLELQGHAADHMVEIALPDGGTARPAAAIMTDAHGSTTLPTQYENSHRATFRRIHAALTDGTPGGDELHGFAADLRTTHAALRRPTDLSRR
jgi:hypothetical protein